MKQIVAVTTLAILLPGSALAATRTYETPAFQAVSVAAGISVDISIGPSRSVMAETGDKDFSDLRIAVEGNVLRIDRPRRNWFEFGRRASYRVRVVTPELHSLTASSGTEVTARGNLEGDFSVTASSGSEVDVSRIKGGAVTAHASSGSEISIAGSCVSLAAHASSGSDLDAEELQCETVTVQASSGSDVSVGASRSVVGNASSGSDVHVRGRPALVQVEKSSGADVVVRN
jgi:hypothetical protein